MTSSPRPRRTQKVTLYTIKLVKKESTSSDLTKLRMEFDFKTLGDIRTYPILDGPVKGTSFVSRTLKDQSEVGMTETGNQSTQDVPETNFVRWWKTPDEHFDSQSTPILRNPQL